MAYDDQTIEVWNAIVGRTKRSTAAMPSAWFVRNVRQLWDGGRQRRHIYRATVDWATSKPSLSNSP
jgi:hypothetical protein